MGKPTGFLEYDRKNAKVAEPLARLSRFASPVSPDRRFLAKPSAPRLALRILPFSPPFLMPRTRAATFRRTRPPLPDLAWA